MISLPAPPTTVSSIYSSFEPKFSPRFSSNAITRPPSTSLRSSSPTPRRHKRRLKRLHAPYSSMPMLLLLTFTIFACRATAALVSTFDNCLSGTVRNSPSHLQFHPILVAAEFDSKLKDLTVTVWGTVTGSSSLIPNPRVNGRRDLGQVERSWAQEWVNDVWEERPLVRRQDNGIVRNVSVQPASTTYFGDSYRSDYRFPKSSVDYNYTGTIISNSGSWPYATKFVGRVALANFPILSNITSFCKKPFNSIDADCPFGNRISLDNSTAANDTEQMERRLGPVEYRNDVTYLSKELPSFTWKTEMPSGYQFASLGVTLEIISGYVPATTVGCIHIEITPEIHAGYNNALAWLSAGILIFIGLSTILAAAFNPWNGTTDLFKFSSNFGMDPDMLRMVTPGFADCLQWLQFIVLTGSLSLSYPGFYQPIVSNGAWSILLLNTSFYSHNPIRANVWRADGIYVPQAWAYGYERLAQTVGLATTGDILVSVLAYFAVMCAAGSVGFQLWFWGRRAYRKATGVEEEDLTSRNWPFTAGMISRFTLTYFLVPLVTACTFQFTVAGHSASALTTVACITLVAIIGASGVLCYSIWKEKPRSNLYDHLPTLLIHGTLYNTQREKHLQYFMIPIVINIMRGITFGALQPSGIAQVTLLAACEIVMILAVYGIKPYARETSMNLWHFIFSIVRLLTILLMMAFVPSINATDAVKSWTGWVILGIHAVILLFGFVLKALQTLLELVVRGYSTDEEAARGGFAKVFGVRQLSRRKRHSKQTHRSSSLTPTPINIAERKHTLTTVPSRHPHSRTNSSAILLDSPAEQTGIMVPAPDGSQSGHGHSNSGSTAAGFTPPAPGRVSGYGSVSPVDAAAGPYYRPPRTRRVDGEQYSPARQSRASWTSDLWAKQGRSSQGSLPAHILASQGDTPGDMEYDAGAPSGSGHRYTDSAITVGSNRGKTDYAVREVDFYYGVRGPALSDQPQRRLGTGPADPTGPVSTAKGWLKQKLGLARGEKEKGFSVVRSSRNPDAILDAQRDVAQQRGGADMEAGRVGMAVPTPEHDSDTQTTDSESECSEPEGEPEPSLRMLDKRPERAPGEPHIELKPQVPRKSSKRRSRDAQEHRMRQLYDPPIPRGSTGRLPFEEEEGEKKDEHSLSFSTTSSALEPPHLIPDDGRPGSGESRGEVSYGRVSTVMRNERGDIRGSQAELVRGGTGSSRGSRTSNASTQRP